MQWFQVNPWDIKLCDWHWLHPTVSASSSQALPVHVKIEEIWTLQECGKTPLPATPFASGPESRSPCTSLLKNQPNGIPTAKMVRMPGTSGGLARSPQVFFETHLDISFGWHFLKRHALTFNIRCRVPSAWEPVGSAHLQGIGLWGVDKYVRSNCLFPPCFCLGNMRFCSWLTRA